jgi:hypothetical protein
MSRNIQGADLVSLGAESEFWEADSLPEEVFKLFSEFCKTDGRPMLALEPLSFCKGIVPLDTVFNSEWPFSFVEVPVAYGSRRCQLITLLVDSRKNKKGKIQLTVTDQCYKCSWSQHTVRSTTHIPTQLWLKEQPRSFPSWTFKSASLDHPTSTVSWHLIGSQEKTCLI